MLFKILGVLAAISIIVGILNLFFRKLMNNTMRKIMIRLGIIILLIVYIPIIFILFFEQQNKTAILLTVSFFCFLFNFICQYIDIKKA